MFFVQARLNAFAYHGSMTSKPLDLSAVFSTHPYAKTILNKLDHHGYEAVLVGGVVRDVVRAQLHGRPYVAPPDVDIATEAMPEQVQKVFPDWPTIEVGKSFGVLMLSTPDGQRYEVATYRTESGYDGRKPGQVELVRSLKQDVQRRDFTINGLAVGLDGQLIDHVDGLIDVQQNLIRTIGDPEERFSEDFLRMLRAVRFACKLEAVIEDDIADAIRKKSSGLSSISQERIREEIFKIFSSHQSRRGFDLLDDLHLLIHILPEIEQLKDVPQPIKYHPEGDVYIHTLLALQWADQLKLSPLSKLAVLLHDIGKPQALINNRGEHMGGHDHIGEQMVDQVGQRMRLTKSEIRTLKFTTREHMRIAQLPRMTAGHQLRFLQSGIDQTNSENFPESLRDFKTLLEVLLCDAQASAHQSEAWLPVLQTLPDCLLRLRDIEQLESAHALLNGHDLIEMGMKPGPQIGELLEKIYDQIFAGTIQSREQALQAAQLELNDVSKSHL